MKKMHPILASLSVSFVFFIFAYTSLYAAVACSLPGDANCDNSVDGIDFSIWLSHYNETTVNGAEHGDFDTSGNTDGVDFSIWLANYGRSEVTGTPEPTTAPSPPQTTTPTHQSTITPTRAVTATPLPTSSEGTFPAGVLGLNNKWKVQLPIQTSSSIDIFQPELATYKHDQWFTVAQGGNAVRFRAPVNGETTPNSNYPRSELREMNDSAARINAAWSTSSGTHTMIIDQAITAVPETKQHVVAGQIHDGDDVIVIRLEFPKLFIDIGGSDGPILDANYVLGERFTVKFEVANNQTKIYYNGATTPSHTLSRSYSGAYFKAGAYTQANCSNSSPCSDSNYGEVVIYNISVSHQ